MTKYCLDVNIIVLFTQKLDIKHKDFVKQQNLKKRISEIDIENICITDFIMYEILFWINEYNINRKTIQKHNKKETYEDIINFDELDEKYQIKLKQFRDELDIVRKIKIFSFNEDVFYQYKKIVKNNKIKWNTQNDHCDFFIAATCILNNLTLVTHDNDFKKLARIIWLDLEDWTQ